MPGSALITLLRELLTMGSSSTMIIRVSRAMEVAVMVCLRG